MPIALIGEKLAHFYHEGFRELYLEGGEPFLWSDGTYELDDVVELAYRIGYFHVHVYTNGALPIRTQADRVWVSIDGEESEYSALRGDQFDVVIDNVKTCGHPSLGVIYTVNAVNRHGIAPFLDSVVTRQLPVRGVFFFFHTPYYGRDELFLDADERRAVVEHIIECKSRGLPVLNSLPGLRAFQSGKWRRPRPSFAIADVDGDYVCCRYNSPDTCLHCGYACCAEFDQLSKLRIGSLRYFLDML